MWTRASRVALLAVFAGGAYFFMESAWPRDHRVDVVLGAGHARVVGLHVEFRGEGGTVSAHDRSFPSGAPARVRLEVDLAPGAYSVLVRTAPGFREQTGAIRLEGDAVHEVRIGSEPR